MRKFCLFISVVFLLAVNSACTRSSGDIVKPGVSLPAVTDLALQKTDANTVKVTWKIPAAIPAEIQQPLSVYVEVNEVITTMKTVNAVTVTLPDAATEYVFVLPKPASTYHFIVKLVGTTKTTNVNYSSNIYSLGQTVVYTK